ncbi:MAG: OmpW family outer membrane protein [Gemmatimonadales bacterium]
MRLLRTQYRPALALTLFLVGVIGTTQAQEATAPNWTLFTRAFVAGGSYSSSPAGFESYSGIGLEIALQRQIGARWAAAFTLRTESREVDSVPSSGPSLRYGSVELLPMSLLVQYQPRVHGAWQPYLGLGATFTVAWEKSGVLDTLDVPPYLGPAVQAGVEFALAPAVLLNLDLRWNTDRLTFQSSGSDLAELKIDPMTIGFGVGFRF